MKEYEEFTGLKFEKMNTMELFPSNETDFGKFLVEQRIKPFLILHILFKKLNKEFYVGHDTITFTEPVQDDNIIPKEKVYGPSIIKKLFTGEELFDTLLSRLGIEQIVTDKFQNFPEMERNLEIDETYENWSLALGNEVLINEDLIISLDKIYYKDEKVKELINNFNELFEKFLEENKNKTSIDHSVYIPLLIKWFPGNIHIRSLTENNSN